MCPRFAPVLAVSPLRYGRSFLATPECRSHSTCLRHERRSAGVQIAALARGPRYDRSLTLRKSTIRLPIAALPRGPDHPPVRVTGPLGHVAGRSTGTNRRASPCFIVALAYNGPLPVTVSVHHPSGSTSNAVSTSRIFTLTLRDAGSSRRYVPAFVPASSCPVTVKVMLAAPRFETRSQWSAASSSPGNAFGIAGTMAIWSQRSTGCVWSGSSGSGTSGSGSGGGAGGSGSGGSGSGGDGGSGSGGDGGSGAGGSGSGGSGSTLTCLWMHHPKPSWGYPASTA